MIKVAFTGVAGSGKDTSAGFLLEGTELTTDAFARRLKTLCSLLFPDTSEEHWYGDLKENETTLVLYTDKVHEAVEFFDSNYKHLGVEFLESLEILVDCLSPRVFIHDSRVEFVNVSPREVMQFLGTDAIKSQNPRAHIEALFSQGEPNVITDVRFPDEVAECKARGYTVVKVSIPNKESRAKSHKSEDGIDSKYCDVEIVNDGTLTELKNKVLSITL